MALKISPKLMLGYGIAAAADLIQLVLFPVTMEGILSPIADVLDIIVGAIMVMLFGWHWAFMPSFMGKLVPGLDLVPLWTGAVFIVGLGEQGGQPAAPGQATAQGLAGMMPPAVPIKIPPNAAPGQTQPELTVHAQPATPMK